MGTGDRVHAARGGVRIFPVGRTVGGVGRYEGESGGDGALDDYKTKVKGDLVQGN